MDYIKDSPEADEMVKDGSETEIRNDNPEESENAKPVTSEVLEVNDSAMVEL